MSIKKNLSLVELFQGKRDTKLETKKTFSKPWPTKLEDYQILDKVASGKSGPVHKAKCLDEVFKNEEIAIKIVNLDNVDIDLLRKEIYFLSNCDHPNILQYYTSFVNKTKVYIVMEFLQGGSILDLIPSNGIKDKKLVASILKQALQGIDYLHSTGQIHRNIKASNFLVDKNGNIRLCDFRGAGSLFEQGERKDKKNTFVGTFCWMAPEVLEQRGHDSKADIWSFGITCIELVQGKPPLYEYQDTNPMKVMVTILKDPSPSLDEKVMPDCKSLVDICLKKDSTKRPTTKELLKHKLFGYDAGSEYIKKELLDKKTGKREKKKSIREEEEKETDEKEISFNFDDKPLEEIKEIKEEHKLDGKINMQIKIQTFVNIPPSIKKNCGECNLSTGILLCVNCKTIQCENCAKAIHLNPRFPETLTHTFQDPQ